MYREWKKIEFPKEYSLYMNLGTTRLRGRPRNRRQDVVREDGRIVGGEGWQEKFEVFHPKVLQHTNTTLQSITQHFIPLYVKINVVLLTDVLYLCGRKKCITGRNGRSS